MEKKRLGGIDAVRTAAILFVIVLHAISLSGILDGERTWQWTVALYVRQFTVSSVPLFLMLSGFLQRKKTFTLAYYKGIIPLYLSYFVISVLCMAAYAVSGAIRGNMDLTFVTAVYKILNFSANGYAWYFEMFLGLFLLIPFLNMVYNAIATKRGKLILVGSLVFLTLLPDTIAGFSPYYDGSGSTVALNIFPDFFKSMYPLTFYYVGCLIAEYKPHLATWKKWVAFLLAPALPTVLIALYTQMRGGYAWYLFNGFQTLAVLLTALAVFLALYDLEIKSVLARKTLAQIALCTFEMYLLSYLWDNLTYTVLNLDARFPLLLLIALVFFAAFLSAFVLRLVLQPIGKGIAKLATRFLGDTSLL